MWDLPRPGLEPVSPALAGRFSTTAPPGKPAKTNLKKLNFTPTRMATIKKIIKSVGENMEKLELTYSAHGSV